MLASDLRSDALQSNEVARTILSLPSDTMFYSSEIFIAIAFDESNEKLTYELLGLSADRLPFLQSYEIFSWLCADRAQRTVDGSLHVCNAVVAPESYLRMWRKALSDPISPQEWHARTGNSVCIQFEGKVEGLREKTCGWSSSPFNTFDEFESTHIEQICYDDDNRGFTIEFDLLQPNAARDAFYLHLFLYRADQRDTVRMRLRHDSLASLASTVHAPDLFSLKGELA